MDHAYHTATRIGASVARGAVKFEAEVYLRICVIHIVPFIYLFSEQAHLFCNRKGLHADIRSFLIEQVARDEFHTTAL
jgi:hypothetical protein